MGERKKIAKNYIFNTSYQLLALIVPLITTPYISRVLRADGIGIYSYTYSTVCYFTLCAISGTAVFGNKQIGVFQDNPEERTKKFWNIFTLRLITSSIALVLYLIYVFVLAENKIISVIQNFYIIGVIFDISWFFQGMENFKQISIRNYIFKIINVIAIFLFVHEYNDLWKYVLSLSLLTWIGNLSVWPFLPKYLVKIKGYKPCPFADVKIILQLFIPTAALQIYAVIDKTMIGAITADSAQNGYYEQAEKIIKMCLMLITALPAVLLPKVSKAYAENKYDEAKGYLYKAYNFVWFLGTPLMFGVAAVSPVLVPVFFGEGYDPIVYILLIMSLLFIAMGLNQTSGTQFFIASGRQNEYTKCIAVGGIVNIGLNACLIPLWGAAGAATASVVGEIVIMAAEFQYVRSREFFSVGAVLRKCWKYMIAGGIMFITLKSLMLELPINVFTLAFLIILGAVMYFVVLFIEKETFVIYGIDIGKKFADELKKRGDKMYDRK